MVSGSRGKSEDLVGGWLPVDILGGTADTVPFLYGSDSEACLHRSAEERALTAESAEDSQRSLRECVIVEKRGAPDLFQVVDPRRSGD
jgi:hypothetical protein